MSGRPITVDDLLTEARTGVERLEPAAALTAMTAGDILVDIRSESQRERDGTIPARTSFPAACSSGDSIRVASTGTRRRRSRASA